MRYQSFAADWRRARAGYRHGPVRGRGRAHRLPGPSRRCPIGRRWSRSPDSCKDLWSRSNAAPRMADVLRAQAADVREASKRALLEAGGRKEISMMVPVVFLLLPITVLFALYPGLVTLVSLTR